MAKKTAFIFGSFLKYPEDDLTLQGDASVIDDVLSLTKLGARQSAGRVLYAPPIKFREEGKQAIFETTITFKITPKGNSTPADGIAFFIAPVDTVIPPDAFGATLGIFGTNGKSPNLFAVEFDTYVNEFEKQLSGPHIGIDINSWLSKATTPLKDFSGKKVTATITYRDRRVTVVAVVDNGAKTLTVSHPVDLKLVLNQYVQVGISAATGDFTEDHFIYSWSFASALVRDTE